MNEPRFKLTPVGACSTPGCAEAIFAELQRYAPARCCAGCEAALFDEVFASGTPAEVRRALLKSGGVHCTEAGCARSNRERKG